SPVLLPISARFAPYSLATCSLAPCSLVGIAALCALAGITAIAGLTGISRRHAHETPRVSICAQVVSYVFRRVQTLRNPAVDARALGEAKCPSPTGETG